MEEPKDPAEQYDSEHGAPGPDPKLSDAEAWATEVNPVRDTPLAGKGLKRVGG
jgi:hypothetical protein